MSYYHASERLQQVRFGRRCYSLLQNARIEPQNLTYFYRTYRLPDDPFFALFFRMKRNYLAEREGVKEARRQYILQAMRALQPAVLANIKYLGYLERYYNGAGRSPVWQQHLYPGSRKKADTYARLSDAAWLALFRAHLAQLVQRYQGFSSATADQLFACLVLELTPELVPPSRPSPTEVNRSYRRLSLLHHPDRGGDQAMFIELKRARDLLISHP